MTRHTQHAVHPLILNRWSPRAFDGRPISEAELHTLLDAAHWAPSAFNIQPWRFIYALRDGAYWSDLLELLIPFNRSWAANASALVFIASQKHVPGGGADPPAPNYSHSFDAGAAWALLAIQAESMGLHVHAMTGFDVERAHVTLNVTRDFKVEAAIAIGRQGPITTLPESLRNKESPSDRKLLSELVFEGAL